MDPVSQPPKAPASLWSLSIRLLGWVTYYLPITTLVVKGRPTLHSCLGISALGTALKHVFHHLFQKHFQSLCNLQEAGGPRWALTDNVWFHSFTSLPEILISQRKFSCLATVSKGTRESGPKLWCSNKQRADECSWTLLFGICICKKPSPN